MNFWWVFLVFFFPFIGGSIGLLVQSEKTKHLKLFLAFSGAFLISITVLNLLPEAYERLGHTTGYYILGGFFLQIVVDFFSKGIEHGHFHHEHLKKGFPIEIFLALSIHALLEGIGLGGILFQEHTKSNLIFAIGLHEMPAAFALALVLKATLTSVNRPWLWISLYASMVPVGMIIGNFLSFTTDIFTPIIAIIIGVFLHISTTIIFENNESHKYGKYKLVAISLGLAIAVLASLGGGH